MCEWKIKGRMQEIKCGKNGSIGKENGGTCNITLCSRLNFFLSVSGQVSGIPLNLSRPLFW